MCLQDTGVRFRQVNAHRASRRARELALICAFGLLFTSGASAQEPASGWRRIAGTSVAEGLAGPATGPVQAIWYAAGSSGLFAQTQSGRVFETDDFVHWRLNTAAVAQRASFGAAVPLSLPESGAKVQAAGARLYAAGASEPLCFRRHRSNVVEPDRIWKSFRNRRRIHLAGGFAGQSAGCFRGESVRRLAFAGRWTFLAGLERRSA